MCVEEKVKSILEKIDNGEICKTVVIRYARFYITMYDCVKLRNDSNDIIANSDTEIYELCKELLKVL